MSEVGIVIATEKTDDGRDVQVDPGGGPTVTAEQFLDAGDDSQALPGDSAALVKAPGQGRSLVVGYADTKNAPLAADGERRQYSRDAEGTPVAQFWLKADGSIVIEVLEGLTAPITIKSAGTITVESPNVLLGPAPGQPVARVGDLVVGQIAALSASPGAPITPNPAGTPGVPFAGQIVSGQSAVKA
jgi:hypothetical protein